MILVLPVILVIGIVIGYGHDMSDIGGEGLMLVASMQAISVSLAPKSDQVGTFVTSNSGVPFQCLGSASDGGMT